MRKLKGPLCFSKGRNSLQINLFGRGLAGSEPCQDFRSNSYELKSWEKEENAEFEGIFKYVNRFF